MIWVYERVFYDYNWHYIHRIYYFESEYWPNFDYYDKENIDSLKYKFGVDISCLHSFGSTTKEEQKVSLSNYMESKHRTSMFLIKKLFNIMDEVKKLTIEINDYHKKNNYKLDFKKNKNKINKINIKLNNFQKRFYVNKIKVLNKPLMMSSELNKNSLNKIKMNYNLKFKEFNLIKNPMNHYLIAFELENKIPFFFLTTSDQIKLNSFKKDNKCFKELKEVKESLIDPNFLKVKGGKHDFQGSILNITDLDKLELLINGKKDIKLNEEGFLLQYEKVNSFFKYINIDHNKKSISETDVSKLHNKNETFENSKNRICREIR